MNKTHIDSTMHIALFKYRCLTQTFTRQQSAKRGITGKTMAELSLVVIDLFIDTAAILN